MRLIVNSIGDANCISVLNDCSLSGPHWDCFGCHDFFGYYFDGVTGCPVIGCPKRKEVVNGVVSGSNIGLVIDFGKFNKQTDSQLSKTESFLLTHFHADHYKGFATAEKKKHSYGGLRHFYYQKLPVVNNNEEDTVMLCFLMCLHGIVSQGVLGCYDFYKNFDKGIFKAVGKGDSIILGKCTSGKDAFEVVWPDGHIRKSDIQKVYNDICKIDPQFVGGFFGIFKDKCEKKFSKKSENRDIIHSDIDVLGCYEALVGEINNCSDAVFGDCLKEVAADKVKMSRIRQKLSNIANSVSVCLFKKNEFLSFGDLENDDIADCIKGVVQKFFNGNANIIEVMYFITAHHGTHWTEECRKIRSDFVVSSNGSRMIRCFKRDYYCSAGRYNGRAIRFPVHNTYCLGDFIG